MDIFDRTGMTHQEYLEAVKRLGPEGRLNLVFRKSQEIRDRIKRQLCAEFPDLPEKELHALRLERIEELRRSTKA